MRDARPISIRLVRRTQVSAVVASAAAVLLASIASYGCSGSGGGSGGGGPVLASAPPSGPVAFAPAPTSGAPATAASPTTPPSAPAGGAAPSPSSSAAPPAPIGSSSSASPSPTPTPSPSAAPASQTLVASPLALSATSVTPGTMLTASVSYANPGAVAVDVQQLVITMRPPGGTHSGGPFDDAAPSIGPSTIAAGSSAPLTASRAILATDPTGTWEAYGTYQDSGGVWHDGPSVAFTVSAAPVPSPTPTPPAGGLWVTAYYAAWGATKLPPSEIDFGAVTHLTHFAVVPRADGSLDAQSLGVISQATASALITPAHAAGRKVLLCVGGGGSYAAFHAAISDAVRPALVKNVVALVRLCGYDGVDVDYEPLPASDAGLFLKLVTELRAALKAADPSSLVTCAVPIDAAAVLAQAHAQLDQVNVMTYDMAGLWSGFETWHNSPLWNGGLAFKSSGGPLPCADLTAKSFLGAGVPKEKLGIGLAFYGYVWNGATGPNQPIAGVTLAAAEYSEIMDTYHSPSTFRWQAGVEAPYLSVTAGGNKFISYDDENLVAAKVAYAKAQGLGGVIVWNLSSGYRPSQPVGSRDVLLQAVKKAAFGP